MSEYAKENITYDNLTKDLLIFDLVRFNEKDLVVWAIKDMKVDPNTVDEIETPLLHIANEEMIKLLLDLGADINRSDRLERTVLWYELYCQRPSTIKLLIDRGADLNLVTNCVYPIPSWIKEYNLEREREREKYRKAAIIIMGMKKYNLYDFKNNKDAVSVIGKIIWSYRNQ